MNSIEQSYKRHRENEEDTEFHREKTVEHSVKLIITLLSSV